MFKTNVFVLIKWFWEMVARDREAKQSSYKFIVLAMKECSFGVRDMFCNFSSLFFFCSFKRSGDTCDDCHFFAIKIFDLMKYNANNFGFLKNISSEKELQLKCAMHRKSDFLYVCVCKWICFDLSLTFNFAGENLSKSTQILRRFNCKNQIHCDYYN